MKWLARTLLFAATFYSVAPAPSFADDMRLISPDQMKWVALDAIPGTEIAVLSGDLGKPGPFVFEWRGPAGTKAAPHWHTNTEHFLLLSGNGMARMSDTFDVQNGMPVPAGAYAEVPAKMHHWFLAQTPFVALIEGEGPFDIHFINSADDPRSKAPQ
jgi:mannose-6-phosphate isomerase-like protein (cupin superfamily)